MTRVGLRGITSRRLRTVLTALAIVLGVAMVSGSYTLTDTMRGAADSLSSSAYDGTAAVVSAKTAFKSEGDFQVRPPISERTLDQVRAVPGVEKAVGSISNRYHESIPGDTRAWIEPEIKVELSSKDYFANRDPVLEAVLNRYQK